MRNVKVRSRSEPVKVETRRRRSRGVRRRSWLLELLDWLPSFLVRGLVRGALRLLGWFRRLLDFLEGQPPVPSGARVLRVSIAG